MPLPHSPPDPPHKWPTSSLKAVATIAAKSIAPTTTPVATTPNVTIIQDAADLQEAVEDTTTTTTTTEITTTTDDDKVAMVCLVPTPATTTTTTGGSNNRLTFNLLPLHNNKSHPPNPPNPPLRHSKKQKNKPPKRMTVLKPKMSPLPKAMTLKITF